MKPIDDPSEVRRWVISQRVDLHSDLAEWIARGRALLEGHFELQGGRHSQFFLRFAGLGWDPDIANKLAQLLVEQAPFARSEALTVVSPESAGLLLGRAVADVLRAELAVVAIDDRRRPTRTLRYGRLVPNRRLLVVNDIITTGASLEPLLTIPGFNLAGILAFAVLSTDQLRRLETERKIPSSWLANGTWNTYEPLTCPLCKAPSSVTSVVPAAEFN